MNKGHLEKSARALRPLKAQANPDAITLAVLAHQEVLENLCEVQPKKAKGAKATKPGKSVPAPATPAK